jgi:hypothetical protein
VLLEPRLHRPPRGKTHGAAPTATAAAAAAAAAAVLAQVKGEASVVHTASQTSTPRRESCLAIASFSGVLSVAPGDCSPSRRVVSKMVSFSRASAPPPAAAAAESARTPVACHPPPPPPPPPPGPPGAPPRGRPPPPPPACTNVRSAAEQQPRHHTLSAWRPGDARVGAESRWWWVAS